MFFKYAFCPHSFLTVLDLCKRSLEEQLIYKALARLLMVGLSWELLNTIEIF